MKGWQKHKEESWRREREEELRQLRHRRDMGHRTDRPQIPGYFRLKSGGGQ